MSKYRILGCILLLGHYPGLKRILKYLLLWLSHWLIVANPITQWGEWNYWHTVRGGHLLIWVCEFRCYLITSRPSPVRIVPANYPLYWESCHFTWKLWVLKRKFILFPSPRCAPTVNKCSWSVSKFTATIITIFLFSLANLKLLTTPPFFLPKNSLKHSSLSGNKRPFSICPVIP